MKFISIKNNGEGHVSPEYNDYLNNIRELLPENVKSIFLESNFHDSQYTYLSKHKDGRVGLHFRNGYSIFFLNANIILTSCKEIYQDYYNINARLILDEILLSHDNKIRYNAIFESTCIQGGRLSFEHTDVSIEFANTFLYVPTEANENYNNLTQPFEKKHLRLIKYQILNCIQYAASNSIEIAFGNSLIIHADNISNFICNKDHELFYLNEARKENGDKVMAFRESFIEDVSVNRDCLKGNTQVVIQGNNWVVSFDALYVGYSFSNKKNISNRLLPTKRILGQVFW